ncbi:MAG: hypothetical protein ACPGUV_02080 [Polyangiales bacterium]
MSRFLLHLLMALSLALSAAACGEGDNQPDDDDQEEEESPFSPGRTPTSAQTGDIRLGEDCRSASDCRDSDAVCRIPDKSTGSAKECCLPGGVSSPLDEYCCSGEYESGSNDICADSKSGIDFGIGSGTPDPDDCDSEGEACCTGKNSADQDIDYCEGDNLVCGDNPDSNASPGKVCLPCGGPDQLCCDTDTPANASSECVTGAGAECIEVTRAVDGTDTTMNMCIRQDCDAAGDDCCDATVTAASASEAEVKDSRCDGPNLTCSTDTGVGKCERKSDGDEDVAEVSSAEEALKKASEQCAVLAKDAMSSSSTSSGSTTNLSTSSNGCHACIEGFVGGKARVAVKVGDEEHTFRCGWDTQADSVSEESERCVAWNDPDDERINWSDPSQGLVTFQFDCR